MLGTRSRRRRTAGAARKATLQKLYVAVRCINAEADVVSGLRDPDVFRGPDGSREAWERYLDSVSDYLRRQIIVYKNWPQRRYNELGYLDEVVFNDMNN